MTDYGHELLFGSFVTPVAAQPQRAVDLALLSERVGLDVVSVQDHPYQSKFLDTWTLLSAIAGRTSRISVMPNVANLPLRPPALLARSVASLDLLSGGRVELGLGAGAFWDGIVALGGTRLDPAQAVDALAEGIDIIRAMWTPEAGPVRVDGKYHRVWGAHAGPAPAHDVGIWVGSYKRRMLALTGRLADGWVPSSPYAPPAELPAMNAAIDVAAQSAGREPAAVKRLYNIAGTFAARGTGFLTGPAAMWAEQLAELTLTEGMSGYIVMGDDPEVVRQFAADVVPAVRERVAAERSGPAELPATAVREVVPVARTIPGLATPTADDGTRRSPERVWDEAARPTGPDVPADRRYTASQRASGQQLIDVHDHLRGELATILELVDQVAAGSVDPGDARSAIHAMTLRQNDWALGAYCQSYCRLVTTHHTLEDISLFPQLRRSDPELAPVVDRLVAEHHVIHDVLDRVDRALVAVVTEPDGMKSLRAAVDLLSDTLLSHLSYEERELVEPLGRLNLL